jgi:hypothetical protein
VDLACGTVSANASKSVDGGGPAATVPLCDQALPSRLRRADGRHGHPSEMGSPMSSERAGQASRAVVDHVPVLWVQPAPRRPAAPLALWLPPRPAPRRTPCRSCSSWPARALWRSASTRGSTASVAPNQASSSPSASSATSGGTCGRSLGRPRWTRCGSSTGQWPPWTSAPRWSPVGCRWVGTSPWRWPASTSGSAGLPRSWPRPTGPAQGWGTCSSRPASCHRARRTPTPGGSTTSWTH